MSPHERLSKGIILLSGAALACGAGAGVLLVLAGRGVISFSDADDGRSLFLLWGFSSLAIAWLLAAQWKRTLAARIEGGAPRRLSPTHKGLLGMSTAVIVIVVAYPAVSARLARAFERQWPETVSSNAVVVTVKVAMDCAACGRSIEAALRKQNGLQKANVRWKENELDVWLDPAVSSKSAVIQAIKANGFDVLE